MTYIGERLKGARMRAGLSLRDLAKQVDVSAQAISKYERGLDVPSSTVLIRLAKALRVRVEALMRPTQISLSQPSYRSHTSLLARDEKAIQSKVQDWLERYLVVETLVESQGKFSYPNIRREITSLNDAERVARELRETWQLGLDPIENLIEVLEQCGIKVGMVEGTHHFDALTLWANDMIPVIVVKREVSGDRQRLSIAHELGHLMLVMPKKWDRKDIEKAAYRFGGAFLVPDAAAIQELGEHRQRLDLYELHLLKHKYGMSMQAWIMRAHDLGIISDATASNLYRQFRSEGWHREEPGDKFPSEKPDRMERLLSRALAENLISETRAEELLGSPLSEFWEEASKQHNGLPLPANP